MKGLILNRCTGGEVTTTHLLHHLGIRHNLSYIVLNGWVLHKGLSELVLAAAATTTTKRVSKHIHERLLLLLLL